MSDGFLSRWSRRKDTARRSARESGNPAEDVPPPGPERPEPDAAEPALTPEEVAALPKPEELTADSDITGFLRRGVPEALRNAALRRAWLLDPAIRDFAGHARDYDFDWNAPGGAPGGGALSPDQVAALAQRVLGGAAEDDGGETRSTDSNPPDGRPLTSDERSDAGHS